MTLGKAGVGVAGPDTFVGPTDVVVNARGEIFVADGHTPRPGAPDGDRIVKLPKDGTFIKTWGSPRGPTPGHVSDRIASPSIRRGGSSSPIEATAHPDLRSGRQFPRSMDAVRQPERIWIDKHDTLYVAVPGQDGGIKIGSAKTGSLDCRHSRHLAGGRHRRSAGKRVLGPGRRPEAPAVREAIGRPIGSSPHGASPP